MLKWHIMKEIANFSIETDNVVLLEYQDGKSKRVAVWQLAKHLVETDLRRVQAALKMRRNFIRDNSPKLGAAVVLTAGLVAALVGGGHAVTNLIAPPRPAAAAPEHETVAGVTPTGPAVVVASATAPDAMQPSAPAVMASAHTTEPHGDQVRPSGQPTLQATQPIAPSARPEDDRMRGSGKESRPLRVRGDDK
jgi:hypothetical protein